MENSETDYGKLGLKCGLEIHQQLNAGGKKLFCNCPSVLRYDEPDFTIKRKLHAVAGEEGGVDVAAMHEVGKGKEFIYQGYDTNCLVELDEEPPHEVNKESLKTALQIALLLNMKVIPISQIMRKTVVDGSNTSGFQRTVLIARGGFIELSFGRVGINGLYLEEDAARIIDRGDKKTIFRLDRLGIPLVEIATSPDMRNPEQVKETALKIGEILRSVDVKRGLGTIRQDLNISTKEHPRVEIKGFQNPKKMIKVINFEIKRQNKTGKDGKSEVRNVLPDGTTKFLRPMPGSSRMYPETDLPILKIPRKLIDEAKKTLPKLKKEIEKEFIKKGLNKEMIKLLFKQNRVEEFKSLLNVLNQPSLVAKSMLIYQPELAKKFGKFEKEISRISNVLNNSLEPLLIAVKKHKLEANHIKEAMKRIAQGIKISEAIKIKRKDINDVEEKILKIIKEKPGLSLKAYMGQVMKEFKGGISGKDASEIIKKYVEKYNKD